MNRIKNQRKKLYEENPYCPFCEVKMILPEDVGFEEIRHTDGTITHNLKYVPDNLCTIEHLYTKFDPNRTTKNTSNEKRRIICCRKCNMARGRQAELQVGIEELRRRSTEGSHRKNI